MEVFLLVNTVFLVSATGYGWLAGSRLDREGVLWIAGAIIATFVTQVFVPAGSIHFTIMIIDVALFAAITSVALRSDRYWPTWFAGFQMTAVLCYAFIGAGLDTKLIQSIMGFWATAALLAMVIGLYRDGRSDEFSR